ncbi:SPJ_0845 family protein [Furfurilactobacillus sp. WILCCON 0119]|uniref:SPJ_0845 family protein n=1 Tax=Furfurilactobacillus entadae TaxID=2922307 RepID=UPI0035E8A7D2
MGLTYKRQDDLDKLFDQFAIEPDDLKDPSKTPLKREHIKDETPKKATKSDEQTNNQ